MWQLLTLGAHAQRGLQYLGLCVCVSVKSHLSCGASVRAENAVTYSAGNEGEKICGDLPAFKSYVANQYSDLSTVSFLRLSNSEAPEGTQ